MSSKIIEYKLHDLKENVILGPFSDPEEIFQIITTMGLLESQFVITQQEISTEFFKYEHAFSMWQHKQKAKKTKDVDGEVVKAEPIIIKAELIG